MLTIIRCALLCVTLACGGVDAQPTGCTDDTHCPADFFCEGHFCRECLHCDTFLREDPIVPTKCIQSVTECGPCKEGLVDDRGGDASVSCVAVDDDFTPLYVWIILGVIVALIPVTALIICSFASSKLFLFKVSGFTSAHTFQGGGAGGGSGAGEPQVSAPPMPPPPYNTHFSDTPLYARDEESPLVKEDLGSDWGNRGAREAEHRQAARVFNNPTYVRNPPQPHSPTPPVEEEAGPEPAALHDEDTMESVWTPLPSPSHAHQPHTHEHRERGSGESAVAIAGEGGAGAGARRALPDPAGPPAKHLCLPPGEGGRSVSGAREEGAGGAGPSVMLNFNLNVNANAVQQLNNVTLFE